MGVNWGDADTYFSPDMGAGKRQRQSDEDNMQQNANNQYQGTEGVLGSMKNADVSHENDYGSNYGAYQKTRNAWDDKMMASNSYMAQQAGEQGTKANQAYTNDIIPQLKSGMEAAYKNSQDAMSLKDAQDPNNKVATAVRNMYGTQANGVQNQGLADYGVMSAMGTQNTMSQMGSGMPMTGSQMMALQGSNMGQASQAFANAQNYANSLRLQGIQAGQDQSNWAYNAGQQSRQFAQQTAQDYQAGLHNWQGDQQGYRNEVSGYNNANYGIGQNEIGQDAAFNKGLSDLKYADSNSQNNRELAAQGQYYGGQNAVSTMDSNNSLAQQQMNTGMVGSIISGGAKAIGSSSGGGSTAATNTTPTNTAAAPQGGGFSLGADYSASGLAAGAAAGGVQSNMSAPQYPGGANYPAAPGEEDQRANNPYATSYNSSLYPGRTPYG